jgi:omega-6 fatty acid desaturase (delta-12 desaturase)
VTGKSVESRPKLKPTEVDDRLRETPLSLHELRQAIPPQFRKPDDITSWCALARVLGSAGICLWMLSLVQIDGGAVLVWKLAGLGTLWVLYGWVLVGLFALGHDCGHGAFSGRSWVNTAIGHLCMSPLANSLLVWRVTHDHHHSHTQLRGQDVDWSANLRTRTEFASRHPRCPILVRWGYRLPFGIFIWIAWNAIRRGANVRSMLTRPQWQTTKTQLLCSNLLMVACVFAIYGGLWFWVGFWGMLKYHGVPAAVAMITGSFILTVQHANSESVLYATGAWDRVRSQLASSFDVRFPSWIEYLWCNINIHVPHHIAPGIPWYHLKKAASGLQGTFPRCYLEERFTPEHLKFFIRTPFLKPVEDKGYFLLDSAR